MQLSIYILSKYKFASVRHQTYRRLYYVIILWLGHNELKHFTMKLIGYAR